MKFKKEICALSFVLFMSGNSYSSDILMLGIDKDGSPVEVMISEEKYKDNLKLGIASVIKSGLPVLEKKVESGKGWMLRSAVIGLGVNLEVGFGKLKYGFLPRFRVGFSNAKEPSIP